MTDFMHLFHLLPTIHICPDELRAAVMAIPFVGVGLAYVRARVRAWRGR